MRIAVICDYAEEQWPSMDICANMLLEQLGSCATRVQPRLIRRFTHFANAPWAVNADRLLNRHFDYPQHVRSLRNFDVFHVTDHSYAQVVHALPAERTVVTCHDTDTFRCLIDPASEPRPRWFRAMAKRTLTGMQKAAAIVCVSEATRAQLIAHHLIAPDRITVVRNGVDPVFQALPDAEEDAERNPFDILHVGSTIARKRIDLLLRIFATFQRTNPRARLIRVGAAFTAEQTRLAADLGVADSIVHFQSVPADILAAIYRRALVVVIPSEAEGFGLPLVEAMACGTPVIASDLAALRETGGSGAEYCPVGEIDAWVGAILRLACNASYRKERSIAGLTQAAAFSWERNGREVMSVYRKILS